MSEEYDLKTDELIGEKYILSFEQKHVATALLVFNGISLCML